MRLKKLISSILIVILATGQYVPVALADDGTSPPTQQQVAPTDNSSSSTDSSPTAAPDQTPAPTPSPSPDQTQGPTTDPGPKQTPGPSGGGGSQPQQQPQIPAPPAYAFNDAAHKWEPTITSSFTWNGSYFTSPFYTYDPVVGWYHTKPSVTPSDAINGLTSGSADPSATLNKILGANDPSISNTGPGSHNNASSNSQNDLLAQLLNDSSVENNINQLGKSGDASVTNNTGAGDATTGAANVVTNLLNLLNAMWSFAGGGFSYFVQNVMGSHTGDITINPQAAASGSGTLGACSAGDASNASTGPSSTNNTSSNCQNDLNINSRSNGSINNNLNLQAQSGNATVTDNTTGGNATSGDARAELNILNLINTAIGAGQSFFGMINIYGDLNGDILFPSLGLNGAVGSSGGGGSASNSNTGSNSTNTASSSSSNNLNVNNDVNSRFNNNINASAQSGNANIADNTVAGNAQTGDTKTNNSLFNLFNTNVFGDNAVLVIINDMGHWVGKIMNLGVSGTSGGGLLTSNATVSNNDTGPNSSNHASSSQTNNANINNSVNGTINNNINVNARSGDATVADNTKGGNATSGSAEVASDVANIFGSQLNFSHIFGILFINVFGSWEGSVGEDTSAGNASGGGAAPVVAAGSSGSGLGRAISHFFPAGSLSSGSTGSVGTHNSGAQVKQNSSTNNNQKQTGIVAAAHSPLAQAKAAANATGTLIVLMAIALLLSGGAYALEQRLRSK